MEHNGMLDKGSRAAWSGGSDDRGNGKRSRVPGRALLGGLRMIRPVALLGALALAALPASASEDSGHAKKAEEHANVEKVEKVDHSGAGKKSSSVLAALSSPGQKSDSGPNPDHGAAKGEAPHWTYSGDVGPAHWGSLSADFEACEAGRMQSPIDIQAGESVRAGVADIEFDYRLTPLKILHNGHTVQVNYEPGSGITVDGKEFALLQFHFHTPSEHRVNGRQMPAEAHFVHLGEGGELAVVGVFLEWGEENLALSEFWNEVPTETTPERLFEHIAINARDILPPDLTYYRYMGSLTTPPCSEGVNWYVATEFIDASEAQILSLTAAIGPNARPVQARHNRLLLRPVGVN